MSTSNVVIVESPAKAKTINKYLGSDYTVLASFGHVRDLPPKDGSVRPDEDFAMDWELGDRAKKHLDEIARAVKGASRVFLATDPDREGEAIAWHVSEVLTQKHLAQKVLVQRVTFHEITKSAVLEAMRQPRAVNQELVDAYLARRALDYLVGFNLSPVLWRKLPGSRSAGRVQSVALRLVCEREAEIEAFRAREYWTIDGLFRSGDGTPFSARLTHLDGAKLDKFALSSAAQAEAAVATIRPLDFAVSAVERKQVRRNPYPPFTTSTLQQEASRKLGLGATATMRIAQKLYEGVDIGGETVGLITYMRTDGVTLSNEAITAARDWIGNHFGERYLPKSPRVYRTTAKNAQEAHEAIRPTDLARPPNQLTHALNRDELRLYELIWKRTIACQMDSAVFDQVAVDITATNRQAVFRANGSVLVFDGFLRVYQEDRDDAPAEGAEGSEDGNVRLPPLKEGDSLGRPTLKPEQHFTQPPPRYTEASLVKKMEELGIGRPSTYASILQVLQDRSYVRLEKKRFIPEDRGRLVTAFLENFFARYVEYGFTADLEGRLDDISGGRIDWKTVLREFWLAFSAAIGDTRDLTITQVIDALDTTLGPHFFPTPTEGGADVRLCPSCAQGRLGLRLSRTGAFIGCSGYPECRYTRPLAVTGEDGAVEALPEGPRELGDDPITGLPVTLRRGPFGTYVQLGPARNVVAEPKKGKGKATVDKPKRVSVPKQVPVAEMTLETALKLLALPRDIGVDPNTQEMIVAGLGRFGPYLKCGDTYRNLSDDDDILNIGLNRAVVLFVEPAAGRKMRPTTPTRPLGEHPEDGKVVSVGSGRFGPYVRHGKVYASIPKSQSPDELTLEQGLELLAAKIAKDGGGVSTARKTSTKSADKGPATKTKTASSGKTASKKTVTEKADTPAAAKAPRKAASPRKKPAAKAE